ncbi:MAG: hypothetical protein HOW73_42845 [Polyangiaceae bacterium]|nr:hypothetical protein [Polyangiaceae bacterium]
MSTWSIATWNVNSLKVRLPNVLRFVDETKPDVLCLQETRVSEAAFPRAPFEQRGYHLATVGTGGYAGVAIASLDPIAEIVSGIITFQEDKAPGRRLLGRVGTRWVDTVYVPTRTKIGKAAFLDALRADHDDRFAADAEVVLAGDFNICFDERDYASPKLISDPDVHPGRPEDLAFRRLVGGRFADCFRRVEEGGGHFTWFPNATWAMKRNYGMRLDYIFASRSLAGRTVDATHDRSVMALPKPSDHVPVLVRFNV